jgi:hypothetical protein
MDAALTTLPPGSLLERLAATDAAPAASRPGGWTYGETLNSATL